MSCASVIFRKVRKDIRSDWGAKVYADYCSIVSTGRRNGQTRPRSQPRRSGATRRHRLTKRHGVSSCV